MKPELTSLFSVTMTTAAGGKKKGSEDLWQNAPPTGGEFTDLTWQPGNLATKN